MKYIVSFIVLCLAISPMHGNNIFEGSTSVSFGITTFLLNGTNPANQKIFPKESEGAIGGGFPNWQSGFSIKGVVGIDKNNTYRIPFVLDYFIMNGVQRLPDKYYTIQANHTIHIPTLFSGFEYAFATLPLANAKAYAGIDLRLSMLAPTELEVSLDYVKPDFPDTTRYFGKSGASRFGTSVKLGIEGLVEDNWSVNISTGYTVFNLLGRDNTRGELFTPSAVTETVESIIGAITTTVLVQYRF
ncbi:MAG: hypothetical protein ACKN9Y_02200 [Bacteroidota bacterium]